MKLLCICPIGIGNYLLCYPAWRLLRRHLPQAQLHLLALRKPILDLAAGDPLWDRTHQIEPTKKQGAAALLAFLGKLRAERYDASLSFFPSNTWQYNLLPLLGGVKKRIAFRYRMKRIAALSHLNTDLHPVDPQLHDVEQNLRFAGAFLGSEFRSEPVEFPSLFSDAEREQARIMLGNNASRHIAIHPGSSAEHGMDAKRWPAERFGKLGDRICEAIGAQALIVGGPDEAALKRETASCMSMPHRIVEPCSLRLTAAILKECTLCLCNDSGIMHLAACCGVPTVALFGPTDERRNGPYGPGHFVIRKPIEGFPLWTAANVGARGVPRGVDPRKCLLELSVDDAWGMVGGFCRGLTVR
jgi:heptosyltransferase I